MCVTMYICAYIWNWVSMCGYIHFYVQVSTSVYEYMNLCFFMNLYVSAEETYICTHMCFILYCYWYMNVILQVSLYLTAKLCLCDCVFVWVYMCVLCRHIYLYECQFICIYVCIVWLWVPVSVSTLTYVCVHTWVSVPMYGCMCAYVCNFVYVYTLVHKCSVCVQVKLNKFLREYVCA